MTISKIWRFEGQLILRPQFGNKLSKESIELFDMEGEQNEPWQGSSAQRKSADEEWLYTEKLLVSSFRTFRFICPDYFRKHAATTTLALFLTLARPTTTPPLQYISDVDM
jgi:hypothetical protein